MRCQIIVQRSLIGLWFGTAEQRIELFRSLFRGRDDVCALRQEGADGRSRYMPKADRDWKSYLRAKALSLTQGVGVATRQKPECQKPGSDDGLDERDI